MRRPPCGRIETETRRTIRLVIDHAADELQFGRHAPLAAAIDERRKARDVGVAGHIELSRDAASYLSSAVSEYKVALDFADGDALELGERVLLGRA